MPALVAACRAATSPAAQSKSAREAGTLSMMAAIAIWMRIPASTIRNSRGAGSAQRFSESAHAISGSTTMPIALCNCSMRGACPWALTSSTLERDEPALLARPRPAVCCRARRRCSGFLGGRLPRPWRQGFQIRGHGLAIRPRQLAGIDHDVGHARTNRIVVRRGAGLEQIGNVLIRPGANAVRARRDVRDPALAFRVRATGEAPFGHDAAQAVAFAVALRAMGGSFDEIGTAIEHSALRRVGHKHLAVEIDELPQPDPAPHVERERQLVR